MNDTTPRPPPTPSIPSKAYSCVRCFKRKVKCDKHHPCTACLRAKVDCIFRTPAPPRRRAPRAIDEAVLARLKHYEELLRANGIAFNSASTPSLEDDSNCSASTPKATVPNQTSALRFPSDGFLHPPPLDSLQGTLIVEHGRTRFIENKLWTTVSEESRHNKDVIPDSDSEDETPLLTEESIDFVLAMTTTPNQTYVLHPSHEHVLKLWQIFLTNVNPLMKIVHRSTLQHSIESMSDTERLPRGLEALMFSVYSAAVVSMRDGECLATFGESRSVLRVRYSLGVRRSLTRARFMGSSDLMVLQALVIYLATMRQDLDSRTLWNLAGVATRIAQGMGVHRDGTVLGLPPFETEMRRRLWWQIKLIDISAAELSGFVPLGEDTWWNTKLPSNVNDTDIWPGMKDPPVEKTGATDMIACLLRYEIRNVWKAKLEPSKTTQQDLTRAVQHWVETATVSEKDAFIDEFQSHLENKYLQYCNPSEPLHMMASIMGRMLVTCKSIQIKAHPPRRSAGERNKLESDRQFLWTSSMDLIEIDNMAHSYRSLQKFNWHTDVNFQWHALLHVLRELILRPIGDRKDDAWSQIEGILKNHQDFISDQTKPLHITLASMCLRAWQARHTAQTEAPQASSWLDTPPFIVQLQRQREAEGTGESVKQNIIYGPRQPENTHTVTQPQSMSSAMALETDQQFQPESAFDLSLSSAFTMPMMDEMAVTWQSWDSLFSDFDARD